MFTVLAIICTIIACCLVPHGGDRHTRISGIGCGFGIIAIILWIVVFLALIWWTIAWLWVHAP